MNSLAEAVMLIKKQPEQHEDIQSISHYFAVNFPYTIKALQIIDKENTRPKRRKGFNLAKVKSKKNENGYLFYVRYSHNGKILPSRWNTRTSDEKEAEKFAIENKIRLVENYLSRVDGRMFKILEGFYDEKSDCSDVSERIRKEYKAVIINKFIPFLKKEKIVCFEQITKEKLENFQDHLLDRGIKPQTVNNNLKAVKKVFSRLKRKKIIMNNPSEYLKGIPVRYTDKKARGCYELDKLKGVFSKRWKDDRSLLLNLLVYTTGMRNSEIKRLKMDDIEIIDGCRFIRIKESKTAAGIRLVPLHDFVFRKMKAWTKKSKMKSMLFDFSSASPFIHANSCLGYQLMMNDEQLEKENITFYSGRHFWKTLMNAEGLGEDIEEVFMGHKVSSNVAKLYNHLDKRGKEMMVNKARQVFSILDRCIF